MLPDPGRVASLADRDRSLQNPFHASQPVRRARWGCRLRAGRRFFAADARDRFGFALAPSVTAERRRANNDTILALTSLSRQEIEHGLIENSLVCAHRLLHILSAQCLGTNAGCEPALDNRWLRWNRRRNLGWQSLF